VVTAVGRQATLPASWSRSTRAGRIGASEYRPLLAALPVAGAIVAGTALNNAPLMTAAALAAFVTALVSPTSGLAIIALMAPLKSPPVIPAPGFNAFLVGATLLGCVYRLPLDKPRIRITAPLLLLLAFVVYVFVQQVPDMLSGYAGVEGHQVGYQFGQLLANAGLVVAAAFVLRGRTALPFVGAGLISAVFAAVIAIATLGPPATGPLGNLVGVSDAGSRATGAFGDPNYFGVFEATAISTSIAWLVSTRSLRSRLVLLGASSVIALALLVALSRGALLAVLAGVLTLVFARSVRAGILAIGVAALVVFIAYPLFVQWRLAVDFGAPSAQAYAALAQSDQARLEAALAGPQLFASAPLFGIGFGHFFYMSKWYVGFPIDAHDWYVIVLAEQGIVGVCLWIPMLAAIAGALYRVSRSPRSLGYAVLAAYAVGCVSLEPPDSVQTSAFAVIVIVAAVVGDWTGLPSMAPKPPEVRLGNRGQSARNRRVL
jgi:O-antigen ligase